MKLMLCEYDFLIEKAQKLVFSFDNLIKSSVYSI